MKAYTSAVEIDHLRKIYGTLVAVDDVSVSVAEGEIFGILGPNGAGKPPPSNAPSGSGNRTPGRSGCSAWTPDPTGFLAMRFFRWE
jgi:ABC-2 type transport system ATP-binding protein